jgi:hypothetical protein
MGDEVPPLLSCDGCPERAVKVYLDHNPDTHERSWVAACGKHQVRHTNPRTLILGVTTVMEAEIRG